MDDEIIWLHHKNGRTSFGKIGNRIHYIIDKEGNPEDETLPFYVCSLNPDFQKISIFVSSLDESFEMC